MEKIHQVLEKNRLVINKKTKQNNKQQRRFSFVFPNGFTS